eukprot:7014204-Prymnesium_polylepis.3
MLSAHTSISLGSEREGDGEAEVPSAVKQERRGRARADEAHVGRRVPWQRARGVDRLGRDPPRIVLDELVVPIAHAVGVPRLTVARCVEPQHDVVGHLAGPAAREDEASAEREQPRPHAAGRWDRLARPCGQ